MGVKSVLSALGEASSRYHLLEKLVEYGRDLSDISNEMPEITIHRWLSETEGKPLIDTQKGELEAIRLGLVKLRYLSPESTITDMRNLFAREDSWRDMEPVEKLYQQEIEIWRAFNPKSDIGEEVKFLKLQELEKERIEAGKKLDFEKPTPLRSAFELGNAHFKTMMLDLCKALYRDSITVTIDRSTGIIAPKPGVVR